MNCRPFFPCSFLSVGMRVFGEHDLEWQLDRAARTKRFALYFTRARFVRDDDCFAVARHERAAGTQSHAQALS